MNIKKIFFMMLCVSSPFLNGMQADRFGIAALVTRYRLNSARLMERVEEIVSRIPGQLSITPHEWEGILFHLELNKTRIPIDASRAALEDYIQRSREALNQYRVTHGNE